jgi:hypothetical protein
MTGATGVPGPVLVRVAGEAAGDYRYGPETRVSERVS